MWIYLIRHAEAEALGSGGSTRDFDRPLTSHGWAQARALARTLQKRGIVLDAVASSPLVRAHQTAVALLEVLAPGLRPVTCDELAIDVWKPNKLSSFLADLPPLGPRLPDRAEKAVAAIGHMPHLAHYLDWLLGIDKSNLTLEKAGAACIRCDGDPRRGNGQLLWLVTPLWYD
ncbi:MAG: histidine phosphatase family protein [Gemmataceae bacterium]|nr:histidine phosphatase family protein [Gemmataceae bacterium]MCS7269997.1 histidine phosphatase family protein [Gemmataceae bacterium]MDW8244607.1 histidine phosphatase family protein [Thermogemmata sp.]